MPHPGDDGRFGPLFNGNSLRPGHRAAADRVGMIGCGTDEPVPALPRGCFASVGNRPLFEELLQVRFAVASVPSDLHERD